MIVSCESCKAKFRIDPGRLKKGSNKVRCSRCKQVFLVDNPEPEEEEKLDLITQVHDQDEEDRFDVDEEGGDEIAAVPPFTSEEIPLHAKKRSKVRVILLGVLLLVALGAGAFYYYTSQPDLTITQPIVPKPQPSGQKAEIEQPTVTILESTQAYFLENNQGGQLFVVEGEALNESPKPVSFVLLEGKLYTTKNEVAISQRCYSGNVMKKEELTTLSIGDIQNRMMNREGSNLNNVHIAPGKRVPFMLVFHNLPELTSLSDYSIEVISAKID